MPTSPDVEFCSSGQVAPEHEDGACPIPCDLAALDAVGLRVDACVSAGALAYSFPNFATYPSVLGVCSVRFYYHLFSPSQQLVAVATSSS